MKLTGFVLAGCPYCAQALELIDELRAERPDYAAIELELIDEHAHPEIAERYDYYHVPSFFLGAEKLYEASPLRTRAEARRRLAAMLDSLVP